MHRLRNSNACHVRSKQTQSWHDKTLLLLKRKPCLPNSLQGVTVQVTPISQGGLQRREEGLRRSEHRLILAGCNMLKEQVLATWPQHPMDLLHSCANVSDGAEDLQMQQWSQLLQWQGTVHGDKDCQESYIGAGRGACTSVQTTLSKELSSKGSCSAMPSIIEKL